MPVSKRFPFSCEAGSALWKEPLTGQWTYTGGVNRNTSEINVPECRRPADPYIERKSVCLTGIFFNLEVKLGVGRGVRNENCFASIFEIESRAFVHRCAGRWKGFKRFTMILSARGEKFNSSGNRWNDFSKMDLILWLMKRRYVDDTLKILDRDYFVDASKVNIIGKEKMHIYHTIINRCEWRIFIFHIS